MFKIYLSAYVLTFYVLLIFNEVQSQEVDIFFNHAHESLMFPEELFIQRDETANIRLTRTVANQKNCILQNINGINLSTSNDEIRFHSEGCGVYINKVKPEFSGRWRLISKNGDKELIGTATLTVSESRTDIFENYTKTVQIGENTYFNFGTKDAEYCIVQSPIGEISRYPQSCNITSMDTSKAASGLWTIKSGLKGRLTEVQYFGYIDVIDETLEMGTVKDPDSESTSMYCNLKNSNRNMTSCRFERVSDNTGFNLRVGHGNEFYTYHGDGFEKHECGITLHMPGELDVTTWKCYLGFVNYNSGDLKEKYIGGFVTISGVPDRTVIADDVVSLNDTELTINCKANRKLSYCIFKNPDGKMYNVFPEVVTPEYWYAGDGLLYGDCGITFAKGYVEDAGEWSCHLGLHDKPEEDLVEKVSVTITTTAIYSSNTEMTVNSEESTTVLCKSLNSEPLDYCRFILPSGVGFSINEMANSTQLILNNYQFHEDWSLIRGQCGVVIKSINLEHEGTWTCIAKLSRRRTEDSYKVYVTVKKGYMNDLSPASISGIAIGAVLLVVVVGGVVYYRYKAKRRQTRPSAAFASAFVPDESGDSPRSSTHSNTEDETTNNSRIRAQMI